MQRSSATPVLCLLKFLHKLRGPLKYEDDARDLCAKDEESLVEEDRRAGACKPAESWRGDVQRASE
jgi:hypothetical protein